MKKQERERKNESMKEREFQSVRFRYFKVNKNLYWKKKNESDFINNPNKLNNKNFIETYFRYKNKYITKKKENYTQVFLCTKRNIIDNYLNNYDGYLEFVD